MGSRWVLSGPITCPLAGIRSCCFHLYQLFSNLSVYQGYLESLLECIAYPTPRVCDSVSLGLGPKNKHF